MPVVSVYIDETGDRGHGSTSSPIFGMAAVLVPEDSRAELRAAVQQLRSDFNVPNNKTMSWKESAKHPDRRRRAAEVLAAVDGVKVCYVYADKASLRANSYKSHKDRFYNYVAFKMFKSVLWAGRNMEATDLRIRFGHVRHHDHTATERYIRREAARTSSVPMGLVSSLRWVSADKYDESQAADLYGGFLKAALWPSGAFDFIEERYLLRVWHQIRNSEACAIPLGIFSMPDYGVLTAQPWFPCEACTHRNP